MNNTMKGFTVIELVMVILIIAIVSVAVMPKWTASSMGLEFEVQRLLNDIRYVQAMSMSSGERYRWVKLSSTSYQITNQAGTAMVLPNGSTQLTFSNGVAFGTLTNLPNNLLAFNAQGTPYTDSAIPGTALAATATIPLTKGGVTRTIQITQQTGFGVVS